MSKAFEGRRTLLSLVFLVLGLGLAAFGCDKKEKAKEPAVEQAAQTQTSPGPDESPGDQTLEGEEHQFHGEPYGGGRNLMHLLHRAMSKIELSDEQKNQAEMLHDEKKGALKEEFQGPKTAFHNALLAAVRSGKVDVADFATHFEALKKVRETRHQDFTNKINKLHAILTPPQRKAVADDVRSSLAESTGCPCGGKHDGKGPHGEGGCPKRDGKGPHGEGGCPFAKADCPHAKTGCPHAANAEGEEGGCPFAKADCPHAKTGCPCGGKHDGKGPHGKGGCPHAKGHGQPDCPIGKLRALIDGVTLSAEQQAKFDKLVESLKSKRDEKAPGTDFSAEKKARLTAVFDAFEKDEFDAASLDIWKNASEKKSAMMTSHVETLGALVAILDETQRNQVAENIKTRAEAKHDFKGHRNRMNAQ